MPYISPASRAVVDPDINTIVGVLRKNRFDWWVGKTLERFCKMWSNEGPELADQNECDVADRNLVSLIKTRFVPEIQEGVLNYTFTRIAVGTFIPHYPCQPREWSYTAIAKVLRNLEKPSRSTNDGMLISAFEGAKLEFYCRVAVPKERIARITNGDINEYASPDMFP